MDLDEDFHVRESSNAAIGQGLTHIPRDRVSQRTVGIARNELHICLNPVNYHQKTKPGSLLAMATGRRN
ncbi:hypothetical protein [Candidatus Raskinella chloraquaticus]|uniref:hypothetical protein n=1 Tax=Candidatus Raskinella chloraquaticus TaxID=1951219 RepID=UPI00366F8D0A